MIDTQAIRNKILDLAMRGKLTEQLLEDGTAEELYQQIQAEKQALIKAGKIKKEKPLPEIAADEVPFEIPVNWKWVRFSSIIDVRDGTHDTPRYYEQGIPLITSKNLSSGCLSFDDVKFISYEDADKINERSLVERGDILFAMIGTIGNPVIVDTDKAFCIKNVALFKRYRGTALNMEFLRFFLLMEQNHLEKISLGGLQPFVSLKLFRMHLIPLPPLAEQLRIAARIEQAFSALDTIDALQAQYADNLTVLKSKLIDSAIHGKLTEQLPEDGTAEELYQQIQLEKARIIKERNGRGDKGIKAVDEDVPYLIPTHWKWIRFGDVGLFKKGPFGSALTKSMFVPKSANAIKVYEQQHAIKKDPTLGTYYISEEYFRDRMKGFEVQSGDIIISCAGTIGETYVMPDGIEPGIINQALMRVTLASGINKKFFQHYFDSRLKSSAKAGNGSAIVNIPPFDVIKNWYFPLPPLAEQKRIVAKLDEVLKMIEA